MNHVRFIFGLLLCAGALLTGCGEAERSPHMANETNCQTRSHFPGDPGRTHYSELKAFNPENVSGLSVACGGEKLGTPPSKQNHRL